MYDINIKNVKKGKNFFYIFLGFGVVFLVILLAVFLSSIFKKSSLDSSTTSTRVVVNAHRDSDGDILYSPTYYYNVDGVEYMCSSNSSSSSNPGTANKMVYYDSKNPTNCMTEYSSRANFIVLAATILPIIFIVVGVININKVSKRVKLIQELNQKGKLVKGLPYRLENTGMVVNNVPIKRPVIDYTLPSGTVIQLYGDPRHDRKTADADGLVDLIIDESNYENYFIDFEINRLSGNLETDYYNKSQQSVETPVVNQDSTSQNAVQPIQSTEQPIQSTEQSMQSTEQPIQSTSEEPVENIETIV